MNVALEKKLQTLPRSPGVYFHKSKSGEIIYVGKAAVLKNRVRQYFQAARNLDAKTIALVNEIHDTDWVETESEIDALFLESEMVKRYMPRYNVLLRDDKSQMFVRIDMKNEWPHIGFTRNPSDDGAEYYGPFYNGFALKKALRYLRKVFPYFVKAEGKETSKLDEDLGLSPRKSEGSDVYKTNLKKLISYIKGNRKSITAELEKDMKEAARSQDFEQAAMLRNKLRYMKELQRRVMFGDREFLDISKDKALSDLVELFGLEKIPSRIEGYDISHQGGMNVVASMVVFTNGVSDRAEYRKFKTKIEKNDDTGNMHETFLRRFSEKNVKSWGVPQLVLIDGGKNQLKAALDAMEARAVQIPAISIAKREEEIIIHKSRSNISLEQLEKLDIPGVGVFDEKEFLVINLHLGQRNAGGHSKNLGSGTSLSPYQDIVKLFQRIRDESHRFAVSYHTVLKRKKQTASVLTEIPGIGPATQKKLIQQFGSLRKVEQTDVAEIAMVIGRQKAELIKRYLVA
ncbi:MAG TPA: helix-hairpin-helix domain-containing protein [Candidatus Saccharimonadales bacterium]